MKENKLDWLRIDGLSNFLRVDFRVGKICWLFVFFGSTTACCYFIVSAVHSFAKFQVTTTYRLQTPTKAVFPTLSICNQNPLNSDYYVQLVQQTNANVSDVNPFYNFLSLESAYKNMTGKYFSQEQKLALFDWDGFVISCTFKNKTCNSSHFRKVFFPYFLNCLQFNSRQDHNEFEQVSIGGDKHSLTLELYVGLPNQLASSIPKRGILVAVLNTNEDPFKNTPAPMSISPGLATKISVKRHVYNRFNAWPYLYNECTVNKDGTLMKPLVDYSLYDYAISTNLTYMFDSCVLYCFNRLCAQHCNCTSIWSTNRVNGYTTCNYRQQLDCVTPFYFNVFLIADYSNRHCGSLCPVECTTSWFDKFTSFNAYPDQLYVEKVLKHNKMLNARYWNQTDFNTNLASNVITFSVNLDTTSYAEVNEQPVEHWDGLLGELGGFLHLCLGMSILSFVEIFEVVCKRKRSDQY